MEVTHQLLTPAALLQPQAVRKVLNIGLGGPQSQAERFRKEKSHFSLLEIGPFFLLFIFSSSFLFYLYRSFIHLLPSSFSHFLL